ncbi:albusnodin/ikarugamycin family macrolactam cyclase [Nocardiopsis alba]|uniref:albusnodin/ikarugamycin family macrolactam cyclase n=1 Tax=Nocardiopsis alba TaxID=53437 RepID=UPI0035D85CB6
MWFGGTAGPSCPFLRPGQARLLTPDSPTLWVGNDWPHREIRTVGYHERRISVFGPCGATDAQLAEIAAAGVPDDVARHWAGSYTLVCQEPGRTRVWTDLGWAWPIYVHTTRTATLWASSSLLLASRTGYAPNLEQLQARLHDPADAEVEVERSYFADIVRIPPGHRLTIDRNGATRVERMWKPELRHRNGLAAVLRAELEAAVDTRLTGGVPISCDLSGGFDSTALALIAGEHLHGSERSVLGVTVHPAGITRGGDLDYARDAGLGRGIHHEWLPLGVEDAPYQGMGALTAADEPPPSAVSHAYLTRQLRWSSRRHDRSLHLTGDGGDGLLLTRTAHLADLVRSGRPWHAVKEAALWAHTRRTSWWRVAQESGKPHQGTLHQRFPLSTGNQREFVDAVLVAGRTARADGQLAQACGVHIHNPYFDSRLVDLCLSIPPEDLPGPARYKPLMAEAMYDLFPPRLAERTTKGDACPDHFGGLRRALPDLRHLIRGRLEELELLDPERFDRVLEETAAGIRSDLYPVEAAVSMEAWLRALTRHPSTTWTSAPVGEHV